MTDNQTDHQTDDHLAAPSPTAERESDRVETPHARPAEVSGARTVVKSPRRTKDGMSLKSRLMGAMVSMVLLAVGVTTAVYLAESTTRLEHALRDRAGRAAGAVRTEIAQNDQALTAQIGRLTRPGGELDRVLRGRRRTRIRWAKSAVLPGQVDIIKVLDARGEILASGHWPASFGVMDPLLTTYSAPQKTTEDTTQRVRQSSRRPPGAGRWVQESTPDGVRTALERWTRVRAGSDHVWLIVGRFLGARELSDMRDRVGADLLAFCPNRRARPRGSVLRRPLPAPPAECMVASRDEPATWQTLDFEKAAHEALVFREVTLPTDDDRRAVLLIGLDRSGIDRLRRATAERALLLGLGALLLAWALGYLLADRILEPVGALADASERIAGGEFKTRVPDSPGGGREVRQLIRAFNTMGEALASSQEQLVRAERVAAWREIARGLAHELKNPLTPILGAMDVIRRARRVDHPRFDELMHEQADAVIEEVGRLKSLADSFARFARLPQADPRPVDIAELFDTVATLYAPEGAGGLHVERAYASPLPALEADPVQLRTALSNLVKNAVESMGEGQGVLTLRVEAGTLKGAPAVVLAVADNGPGVDDEVKDRLFTPYVTTKGSRGTGLGLALVHRIVTEHKGTIALEDTPGGGATFVITLPAAGASRDAD